MIELSEKINETNNDPIFKKTIYKSEIYKKLADIVERNISESNIDRLIQP